MYCYDNLVHKGEQSGCDLQIASIGDGGIQMDV